METRHRRHGDTWVGRGPGLPPLRLLTVVLHVVFHGRRGVSLHRQEAPGVSAGHTRTREPVRRRAGRGAAGARRLGRGVGEGETAPGSRLPSATQAPLLQALGSPPTRLAWPWLCTGMSHACKQPTDLPPPVRRLEARVPRPGPRLALRGSWGSWRDMRGCSDGPHGHRLGSKEVPPGNGGRRGGGAAQPVPSHCLVGPRSTLSPSSLGASLALRCGCDL